MKFNSLEDGYNAMIKDLTIKVTGKSSVIKPTASLLDMIKIYAPSKDRNNPERYAAVVSKELGVPADTPIKDITDIHKLAKAMILVEDNVLYKHMFGS